MFNTPKVRIWFRRAAVVGCLGWLGLLISQVRAQDYLFSFEQSFEGWEIAGDMPYFPCFPPQEAYPECEQSGQTFERLWTVRRSLEQAQQGLYSLKMTADGRSDDGTVWIMRSFPAQPNTDYRVRLSFYLGLLRESPINPWSVVAYAGTPPPQQESDFTVIGHTGQGNGWVPYSYASAINTGEASELWIACGFRVNWETWRTFYLDTVKVSLSAIRGSGVRGRGSEIRIQ